MDWWTEMGMHRNTAPLAILTTLLLAAAPGAAQPADPQPAKPEAAEPEAAADTDATQGAPKAADAAPASSPATEAQAQAAPAAPAAPAVDAAHAAQTAPDGEDTSQEPLDPSTVRRALAEQRARLRSMLGKPAVDRGPRTPQPRRAPPSAGAPFSVGVRATVLWNSDPSYDLFAEHDVKVRGSIFAAYDLWSIQPDIIAAVELAYGGDSQKGRLLERFDTDLERQLATAGVDVRYVLWPWLQPHMRLATGLHYTQTTIDAETGDGTNDSHYAPVGQLGAGVTVRTPTRLFQSSRGRFAAVSLGLKLEAGYLAVPSATVEVGDATVGELSQSGAYLEAAAVVRF